MKYFKRQILERRDHVAWESALRDYKAAFKQFEQDLPESIIRFDKRSKHDMILQSVVSRKDRQHRRILDLVIDEWKVTFFNVKKATGWYNAVDTSWLYDELYPAPGGWFELLVLMDDNECCLVAADVLCINLSTKQEVVSPDWSKQERSKKKRRKPYLR